MSMTKYLVWSDNAACTVPMTNTVLETAPEVINNDDPVITASRTGSTVTLDVNITDVSNSNTNEYLYSVLLQNIKTYQTLKLTELTGRYKVFVDMAFYDNQKNVIEEGVKIHEISAVDVVKLFDVTSENVANYVVCKKFTMSLPFSFPVVHTGVIGARKEVKFIRVKSITIMAEQHTYKSTSGVARLSQTILDHTINPLSPTITQAMEDMITIYSSTAVNFGVISLQSPAVTIDLKLNLVLGGFIWANSQDQIDALIAKNIEDNDKNGNGIPDVNEDDDPTNDVPVPGGSGTPSSTDENNYFEQWERCIEDDPNAHIVVKDLEYDSSATPPHAKYSEVVLDIPDIEIGEYVHYIKSIVMTDI